MTQVSRGLTKISWLPLAEEPSHPFESHSSRKATLEYCLLLQSKCILLIQVPSLTSELILEHYG